MDAQYLTQLKQQRTAIESFLQVQRDGMSKPMSTGVRIAIQIYIQILEDALKIASSLIHHLELGTENTIDTEA